MSRCLFSPRSPKECILGEHLHRCQRRMSELGMPPYGRYPSDSIPPEGGAAPPTLCTPRESILSGQESSSELLRRRVQRSNPKSETCHPSRPGRRTGFVGRTDRGSGPRKPARPAFRCSLLSHGAPTASNSRSSPPTVYRRLKSTRRLAGSMNRLARGTVVPRPFFALIWATELSYDSGLTGQSNF